MDSTFAFNKLLFVEMERKNILLNRRIPFTSELNQNNNNQINSSFLSRFLSSSTPRTKGSVSKCLFGRPEEGETKRLEQQMLHKERMRALNMYQFDIVTQQPVNLTPPASPYIGHHNNITATQRIRQPRFSLEQPQQSVDELPRESVQQRLSGSDGRDSVRVEEKVELVDTSSSEGNSEICPVMRSSSLKRRSSDALEEEEEATNNAKATANKKTRLE